MRFEVEYRGIKNFGKSRICSKGTFYGKGRVHINDIGLVLEGDFPKFHIPVIAGFYKTIICEWTYRTIPYSRIMRYKAPVPLVRRHHKIIFKQPNGNLVKVLFKMIKSSKKKYRDFTKTLEEHRVAFAPSQVI